MQCILLYKIVTSFLLLYSYKGHTFGYDVKINKFHEISNAKCEAMCDEHKKCTLAIYRRRMLLCEVYHILNTTLTTKAPGEWIYTKHDDTLPETCSKCAFNEKCDDAGEDVTCVVNNCGMRPSVQGTRILGNIFSIQSVIKYQCIDKPELFEAISCLNSGLWSKINLACYCAPPDFENGNVTVVEMENGTFKADIICTEGYKLRQSAELTCQADTNTWNNLGELYCEEMTDRNWTRIYSFPKEMSGNIIPNWDKDLKMRVPKFYRNSTFIDNWEQMPLKDVKLSVIKNNEEVAFIIFDGKDSNSHSWYDTSRIKNSSWVDLDRNTKLAHMSWEGIWKFWIIDTEVLLRHLIAEKVNPKNCLTNIGWFVATYFFFPCDSYDAEIKILYSKGKYASKFLTTEMGEADRYEVWVN